MPTMPNIIGRGLWEATAELEAAGVIVLANIGYFDPWPITAAWVSRNGGASGIVTAQLPASGLTVAVNPAITLTVTDYPMGVSYPG